MNGTQVKIVYSPKYDIRLGGIEKLHPFDSCKYSRAWNELTHLLGKKIEQCRLEPEHAATDQELAQVHAPRYLESLSKSKPVAKALEIPMLKWLPSKLVTKQIVEPMKWSVSGTILALEQAIKNGIAINLSGGYHHASANRGEGFCLFADVGIAIAELRKRGLLDPNDAVLIIDLDAHQGNGNEHVFRDDAAIHIFDMYNKDIYPNDIYARERINCDVPVVSGTGDEVYMALLQQRLPLFIRSVPNPKIAIYNAGTDIVARDPLGALNVSSKGVLERDKFVFHQLAEHQIPFLVLPSGGYTNASYKLIADSIAYLLRTWSAIDFRTIRSDRK